MSSTPYMKFYIGDYLADTQHLSCLEHGAYVLLIFAYWQNGGPLPNDTKLLRRYTRTDANMWRKCSKNVLEMFHAENDVLIHARIEKELAKRAQVSIHNTNAINKRWNERNTNVIPTKYPNDTIPIVHSPYSYKNKRIEEAASAAVSVSKTSKKREKVAKSEPLPPSSSRRFLPPSVDQVRLYCDERRNKVDPATFCDFYAAKGWKIGKETMKDWQAAVRTWEKRSASDAVKQSGGALSGRADAWTDADQAEHRRALEERDDGDAIDFRAAATGPLAEILKRGTA